MILEQNDEVELISIKTKSLEDLDNEDNFNINNHSYTKNNCSPKAKNWDFSNEPFREQDNDDDHYESSLRFIAIDKSPNGACGFHLTRTKWDPYPWVQYFGPRSFIL